MNLIFIGGGLVLAASALAGFAKRVFGQPGTVAAVPGLIEAEKREPGLVAAFLRVMSETGADPDKMAALISEESGWRPDAGYNGGTSATGLFQVMPKFALGFTGYTAEQLHRMTAIEQMGALKTLITKAPGYKVDPPMQGWGNHVGAPDSTVIAHKDDPTTPENEDAGTSYASNAGYDVTHKGYITAGDVRSRVYHQLAIAKGRIDSSGKLYPGK